MATRFRAVSEVHWTRVLAVCLVSAGVATLSAATKQPIKKPTYDPGIPEAELFDAMERGQVEATVIPKSAMQANLFITNKSGAPLSVKIPQAVVAVHVLKQFFGPQAPGGQNATGQTGNNNGQAGGGQSVGGGVQNGQGNNGPGIAVNRAVGNPPGNFIFSIAPEKTIQLSLKTVCLAHGKPDPRPKMTYRLVKVEEFTTDPVLPEVLKMYASGEVNSQVAQAAAWHLSDKLSWKELQEKDVQQLGGTAPKPYFTVKELKEAQDLIAKAAAQVKTEKPVTAAPEKKL